jgi:peptide deformylase
MYFDNLENMDDDFWSRPERVLTIPEHEEFLTHPTKAVDKELGEKIAAKLLITLNYLNKDRRVAIGLAANQIGIDKAVFVINVDRPLYFINPDVIELSKEKSQFNEGCLSVPKKRVPISRHLRIKVKADNLVEPEWFGVEWDGGQVDEIKMLESFTIQHEFNHLHGILITDLDERPAPFVAPKEPGRNDKINIVKDEQVMEIKYKHFNKYQKQGWKLNI